MEEFRRLHLPYSAAQLYAASGKGPIIGHNGNWWTWNMDTSVYRDTGVAAGTVRPVNPNLLDNAYFIDPINQRGLTEYTKDGYTIDRWKLSTYKVLSVELVEDGLACHVHGAADYPCITQEIESPGRLSGGTFTLSLLIRNPDGLAYSFSVKANGTGGSGILFTSCAEGQVLSKWTLVTATGIAPKDLSSLFVCNYIGIKGTKAGTLYIKAAKLELGPEQTLAHLEGDTWVQNAPPPNKALELLKCQRYFQGWNLDKTYLTIPACGVTGTTTQGVRVVMTLPTAMRADPTVTFSDGVYVFSILDGQELFQKITGVQWTQVYGNTVRMALTVDTAASVNVPIVGLRIKDTTGKYFHLSSDL